jgi:hypothetical protein
MAFSKNKPTQRELTILCSGRLGSATVRPVHEELNQLEDAKKVGYTITFKFI